MNQRDSLLSWSFSAGTCFETRIRVSLLFPIILAIFCVQTNLKLGLTFGLVLFLSVLLHEFGHIIGARRTGGSGNEILLWPLGGLASVQPGSTYFSRMMTTAAGPIVNFILCLGSVLFVIGTEYQQDALNPLVLPAVPLGAQFSHDLLVLLFAANWLLLLVNLIPVAPLDGGRMLQTFLMHRMDREHGTFIYLRIGLFFAFLVGIAGLFLDHAWIVAIGAVLLVLNLYESQQMQQAQAYDESFMGYDFSQGYTSLEQSHSNAPTTVPARKGILARWKEKRRNEKARKQHEQEVQQEQLLDELLEKIQNEGVDSLTPMEKRLLSKVSARYREREQS